MPTVTLPMQDDTIRMPRVCIVCGSSSCRMKKTTFQARFSTLWGLGRSGTRFLHCTVPLCREHETHFDGQMTRGLMLVGSIFGVIALSALLAALIHPLAILGGMVLCAVAIGVFYATDVVAKQTLVHATRITKDEVTLKNVHRKFVAAVEGEEDEKDDRSRRSGEDEDWGFRKRDKDAEGKTALIIWMIVGGVFLVMLVGIFVTVLTFVWFLRKNMPPQGPAPVPVPVIPQPPPPVVPDPPAGDKAYLSDLPEFDVSVGWGTFGKNGLLGFEFMGTPPDKHRIVFDGKAYPKGLSMHPPDNGSARAKYRLNAVYRTLAGAVAMADLPPNASVREAPAPVTFTALGDGRSLWTSRPLQKRGDKDDFRIDVSGVKVLELRTASRGRGGYQWAVWLDPLLTR